jgi:O-antigen/teichoic acid export membrane protein
MLFSLALSILYGLLTILLGDAVVISLFQKPEIKFLVPLAALGIVATFVYNMGWNGCIATASIWANGTMLVTQMCAQALLAPLSLFAGYGIFGVTTVYLVLGPLVAGAFGIAVALRIVGLAAPNFSTLKSALAFGLPLAGGSLVGAIQTNLYNALLSRFGTSVQLGNYSVAQRVGPLVEVVGFPIQTLSFPTFSKLSAKESLVLGFRTISKVLALLTIPVSMMTMVLSPMLIIALYGNGYAAGWPYLSLLSVSWLISGFGATVANSLLTGQAKTTLNFRLSVVGSMAGILASLLIIPFLGVNGASIVSAVAALPPLLISLRYVSTLYGARYPFGEVVKVLLLSAVSTAIALGLATFAANMLPLLPAVLVSAAVGLMFYAISVKRFEVIGEEELMLIARASSSIPFIGGLLSALIYFYNKI